MAEPERSTVAYIVSMPHGLDAWTYRDIVALARQGIDVSLFPVKYEAGPYMPRPEWPCYRYSPWLVLLRQPVYFLWRPFKYLSLLVTALRTRSMVNFLLGFDFAHRMASSGIRMVHCVFGDHKLFVGYYCKRILGIPLSVALYGFDLRYNPNWPMFRKAVGAADAIVVNCDFNRKLLSLAAGEEAARRAQVIRHYSELPQTNLVPTIKVLIVGRFEERKGHDLLFRAVELMGETGAALELWVAGVPGQVDVEQLARSSGISDRVRVFGAVSDEFLQLLYQQCDIFCLPSRTDVHGVSEGLPVSLIEAMAHGKPVISTRLAGIPELVEEILIDESDVPCLANALSRLAKDPALRQAMGARNRTIVESRYSSRNLDALRDLFLETLEGRAGDGRGEKKVQASILQD